MEFDWSIAAWIAGLIFVYLFGLFEGRSTGYKKRKTEEEQAKNDQPPSEPERVKVDDPGLLRIKNENGSFALDLDGARVNPISLLPEQRKRLIEILNIMRPWLEGRSAPAPASSSKVPPPPPSGNPTSSPLPASRPSLNQTHFSPDVLREDKPIPVQPASPPPQPTQQPAAPKPATIAKEERPAAPANSIVTQIDTILQEHLAGTPLDERGIFLTQSPEGGVLVYIGLTRYHGVDEVPDAEIKAAIRAAITEWENKYTPGL